MTGAKIGGRLRPGELDGQVLAYMRRHKNAGTLTASAISKGIERSAGAISNCLARLAKDRSDHGVAAPTPSYEGSVIQHDSTSRC